MPLGHGRDDFVDQFAADRPDARAAENFAGLRIRQQFHETVLRLHDERFAVVIERITRGQIWNIARLRRLFRQADECHLRIGEHDGNQQPVIHPARCVRRGDVVRRNLALLHGEVNNLVRSGAIARRVNVRRAGLHEFVRDNAPVFGFHTGLFQIQ